jgi:hypothetical protein
MRRIGCALVLLAVAACDSSSSSSNPPVGGDGGTFDSGNGGGGDDAGTDGGDVPSICPTPTGAPISHNSPILADETWGAGLHDVTFDVHVHQNATLTIAPCAVVRVAAAHEIVVGTVNVGDGGKIVAKGKADMPIVFQAKDATQWADLLVYPTGYADLAYVKISGGGEAKSTRGGASFHLVGDGTQPMQLLANVDHVSVDGGAKYAVILESRGAFAPTSQNLTVKGSAGPAMRASAGSLVSIPTGSYTGNAVDAIRILPEYINADQTIHDRGVPYLVGGDGATRQLSVQGAALGDVPVLTIEPGVTMKWAKSDRDSGLFIERASTTDPARGALVAVGTAAKPIVFTSEEAAPAAGDWIGIIFNGVPDTKSKIEFAHVEYAGGDTGTLGASCGTPNVVDPAKNEAAIAIYGIPPTEFVQNTTITASARNAFERGWTGGNQIDFLATNTFAQIANCRQTYPHPTPPAVCADPPPCD